MLKNDNDGYLPAEPTAPTKRALAEAGITRVEQLAKLTESDAMKLHGIGLNAIKVLQKALVERRLPFHDRQVKGII